MIYERRWQMDGADPSQKEEVHASSPESALASRSPESTLVGLPTAELVDVSADDEQAWVSYDRQDLFEDTELELYAPSAVRMTFCDMITAIFIPWTAFVLSLVIFICLYHDHAVIVWILQLVCTLLAVCTVLTGHRVRDAVLISLGLLTLASIALGAATGTWLEAEYLQRFWQLYRASSYQLIQPNADATPLPMDSFLRFPDGTTRDDTRSLGYLSKGNLYCVAPIQLPGAYVIRYWSVGKKCCERRGTFNCGPAPEHAAVMAERLDETFHRAVLQASSVYQLHMDQTALPQLVTLIEHPSQVLAEIWYESTRVAVMAGLMHLAVCVIAVLTMATATANGRKLKDSL